MAPCLTESSPRLSCHSRRPHTLRPTRQVVRAPVSLVWASCSRPCALVTHAVCLVSLPRPRLANSNRSFASHSGPASSPKPSPTGAFAVFQLAFSTTFYQSLCAYLLYQLLLTNIYLSGIFLGPGHRQTRFLAFMIAKWALAIQCASFERVCRGALAR